MHAPHQLIRGDFATVEPRPHSGGKWSVVVLDRIEPDVQPDYILRGQATCAGGCGEWLWLGDKSYPMVREGRALGMCQPCAVKVLPADSRPYDNVDDTRL